VTVVLLFDKTMSRPQRFSSHLASALTEKHPSCQTTCSAVCLKRLPKFQRGSAGREEGAAGHEHEATARLT